MVLQDDAIGLIYIRRAEPGEFSDKQVALLETFAAQAVIAIENARLFGDLRESLEQQTATAEVLNIIASSPTEVQPVLDGICASAARVCGAASTTIRLVEGQRLRAVARHGPDHAREDVIPLDASLRPARAVLERRTISMRNTGAETGTGTEFPDEAASELAGRLTVISVPLIREAAAIGVLSARRNSAEPFTDRQVALLETFANQAVIAIENVRLFQEVNDRNRDLSEALEHQTATADVLSIIASSPTDLQPVFDTINAKAAELCAADDAVFHLVEGDMLRRVDFPRCTHPSSSTLPIRPSSVAGRAILEGRTIHVERLRLSSRRVSRGRKAVSRRPHGTLRPLKREGVAVGAIVTRRGYVEPFTDRQIALLETFASQAVIAIENVRLFREINDRNAELHQALEQQTAMSEVLRIIAGSPSELDPVWMRSQKAPSASAPRAMRSYGAWMGTTRSAWRTTARTQPCRSERCFPSALDSPMAEQSLSDV